MDKTTLQPLSGFRDYNSPVKDRVAASLRQIFQSFGYQTLETPSLEKREVLLGKLGGAAEKLLYLFEDNGARQVGLRYDLTVPLARFVAANYNELPLPFKRYEIGNVWRAERAQKGRYRQFTQADIDIVGDNGALGSEKELLAVIAEAQKALKIDWLVLMNDRQIVRQVFESLKVPVEQQKSLLMTLDKKDKLTEAELDSELKKVGLSDVQLRQVNSIFLLNDDSLGRLKTVIDDQSLLEPIDQLLRYGESLGLKISFAPFMVRGLDYYTGTIIECVTPDFPSSLVGGGRYDNLIESFGGGKLPGVGVSFGVDRIADYLSSRNEPSQTLFLANLPETETETSHWLEDLRRAGRQVERYVDATTELGKQIKYASKRGFASILIPLEADWKDGNIIEKNLETGEQQAVKRTKI